MRDTVFGSDVGGFLILEFLNNKRFSWKIHESIKVHRTLVHLFDGIPC